MNMEIMSDAMALYSSGYPNSIAMFGTAMPKIETLLRYTRNIVWALDSDYAGKMGSARILNELLRDDSSNETRRGSPSVEPQRIELKPSAQFRMATFPDSAKDPAACFEKYGAEKLANFINFAPAVTAHLPAEDIKRPVY